MEDGRAWMQKNVKNSLKMQLKAFQLLQDFSKIKA